MRGADAMIWLVYVPWLGCVIVGGTIGYAENRGRQWRLGTDLNPSQPSEEEIYLENLYDGIQLR